MKKVILMAISVSLISSILAGCGGRLNSPMGVQTNLSTPNTLATPLAQTDNSIYPTVDNTYPVNNNYPTNTFPYNSGMNTMIQSATPNNKIASFKVDQSTVYDWQARGVAVNAGSIYIAVADTTGLIKAGSVIKMNSSDGKNYKDIGSRLLGLSHPISSNVKGVTVAGGTVLAVDDTTIYSIDSNGKINKNQNGGGNDIAAAGGVVYVATKGMVARTDTNGSSLTPLNGVLCSGGIGVDNSGNLYTVNGNLINRLGGDIQGDMMGLSSAFSVNANSPIDVAVDNRNGDIYVLDGTDIKRFDQQGNLLVSFPSQAKRPVSIATDEQGNVYVADAGSSSKDSYIIKFGASNDSIMNSSNYQINSNYSYSNQSQYSNYSLPSGAYTPYATR